MPFERSAGAVIFKKNKEIKYLLLHYPSTTRGAESDYWDFPKGHIEKGENELTALKREVEEETGLKDLEIVDGFKEWIKYFFKHQGKNVFKIVTFYLAETKTEEIKISPEHIGYQWLAFQQALNQLKFDNAKNVLKKVNSLLNK